MTHETATESGIATRYCLGELPDELCGEFEDHAFDCPRCARELAELDDFLTHLEAVAREDRASRPRTAVVRLSVPAEPSKIFLLDRNEIP